MIKVKNIDVKKLESQLNQFGDLAAEKTLEAVRQAAGILAKRLAFGTQPFGLGTGSKKMGETAVARDIRRVFVSPSAIYDELEKESPGTAALFWKAWKARDTSEAERIGSATTAGSGLQYLDQPDKNLHQARRARNGRVRGKQPGAVVFDRAAINDYIRARQAHVGLTKAGWLAAAESASAPTTFPAWAGRRHANRSGSATVSKSNTIPKITLRNNTPWARQALPPSMEEQAVDIAENILRKTLEAELAALKI